MIFQILQKGSRRKGVEAIFSSSRTERDARFVIGLAGILAGLALWTIVLSDLAAPRLLGGLIISSYLTFTLGSLGLLFAICGSGVCLVFSVLTIPQHADGIEANSNAGFVASKILPDQESRQARSDRDRQVVRENSCLFTPNLSLGLVAFIQSCVLLILYAGLVEEYKSNITMQLWIRSVLPTASYVLNWPAVIVGSVVLAILVVQFLPRGLLSR